MEFHGDKLHIQRTVAVKAYPFVYVLDKRRQRRAGIHAVVVFLRDLHQQELQCAFRHSGRVGVPAGVVHQLPEKQADALRGSASVLREYQFAVGRRAAAFQRVRCAEMPPQIRELPGGSAAAKMPHPRLQQPFPGIDGIFAPARGNAEFPGKDVDKHPAFHYPILVNEAVAAGEVAPVVEEHPGNIPRTKEHLHFPLTKNVYEHYTS